MSAIVLRASTRMILLIAAVALLAVVIERAARPLWPEAVGPGTKERIDLSFAAVRARAYECVIVGNSRVYRGINPDRLGPSAYNFAQDDDAFNQVFYKLGFLEANGVRPGTVIMGVDYFQFSFLSEARNHAYAAYFPRAYLDDFPKPSSSGVARLLSAALHPIDENTFNAFMVRYFTRPAGLLVEQGLRRLRGKQPPVVRTIVRDNGQYVLDAPPAAVAPIERDPTRLPIQERYFEASLEWAARNRVRLFLVMPPLRRLERDGYAPGVVEAFDQWLDERARAHGATYLNFSTHSAFSDSDFADETHLTTEAADRFSDLLGQAIRSGG